MIDFYREFNIPPDMGIEEIHVLLSKERTVWVQREQTMPEEGRKKQVMLDEADKVFKNEYTRRQYNHDLEESKKTAQTGPDPYAAQKAAFNKWYAEAQKKCENKEYVLAQTAIVKAMEIIPPSDVSSSFYVYAAEILVYNSRNSNYIGNGNYEEHRQMIEDCYQKAKMCVDEEILFVPDNLEHYLRKYDILNSEYYLWYRRKMSEYGHLVDVKDENAKRNHKKEKLLTLQTLLDKAQKANDIAMVAVACDCLSEVYYDEGNGDCEAGEKYAQKAIETGKDCPYARILLLEISKRKIKGFDDGDFSFIGLIVFAIISGICLLFYLQPFDGFIAVMSSSFFPDADLTWYSIIAVVLIGAGVVIGFNYPVSFLFLIPGIAYFISTKNELPALVIYIIVWIITAIFLILTIAGSVYYSRLAPFEKEIEGIKQSMGK